MILIDTHIWIWWVDGSPRLLAPYLQAIEGSSGGIGVSAISCWEIAKKIEKESRKPPASRTLDLSLSVEDWIQAALRQPGVVLIPLSPAIIIESTRLPGDYNDTNPDPADQLVIATSRIEGIPLMTVDTKITAYPHVQLWTPPAGS